MIEVETVIAFVLVDLVLICKLILINYLFCCKISLNKLRLKNIIFYVCHIKNAYLKHPTIFSFTYLIILIQFNLILFLIALVPITKTDWIFVGCFRYCRTCPWYAQIDRGRNTSCHTQQSKPYCSCNCGSFCHNNCCHCHLRCQRKERRTS